MFHIHLLSHWTDSWLWLCFVWLRWNPFVHILKSLGLRSAFIRKELRTCHNNYLQWKNVLKKANDDLWRGPETLSPLKTKVAAQRPPSPNLRGLGLVGSCGLGDGRHRKERLFQEPQERKEKNNWENSTGEEECVCCWGVKQHKSLHQTDGAQTNWEESKPGSMKHDCTPCLDSNFPSWLPPPNCFKLAHSKSLWKAGDRQRA